MQSKARNLDPLHRNILAASARVKTEGFTPTPGCPMGLADQVARLTPWVASGTVLAVFFVVGFAIPH